MFVKSPVEQSVFVIYQYDYLYPLEHSYIVGIPIYKYIHLVYLRELRNFTLNVNIHRIVIMKKLLITFFTVFFCLTSSIGWSLELNDLVKRDGIYYEKFSDVPFTGKTTGPDQGSFKNGKKDGSWISYWGNGQLSFKGDYKNDKREGSWVRYWDNGQLNYKGDYKNGKREGSWVSYHENGQLNEKSYIKNGEKDGSWVRYWKNGQLRDKGDYKNGKKEGSWISYYDNGTVFKELTGTYKNDIKVK